jgi:hypothetical protein
VFLLDFHDKIRHTIYADDTGTSIKQEIEMNQQQADKIAREFEDKTHHALDCYFKDEGWGFVYGLDHGGTISITKATGAVSYINDQDEEVGADTLEELLAYIPTTDDQEEENIAYTNWLKGIEEVSNAHAYLRKAFTSLSLAELHFNTSDHTDLENCAKYFQSDFEKLMKQINERFELDL